MKLVASPNSRTFVEACRILGIRPFIDARHIWDWRGLAGQDKNQILYTFFPAGIEYDLEFVYAIAASPHKIEPLTTGYELLMDVYKFWVLSKCATPDLNFSSVIGELVALYFSNPGLWNVVLNLALVAGVIHGTVRSFV